MSITEFTIRFLWIQCYHPGDCGRRRFQWATATAVWQLRQWKEVNSYRPDADTSNLFGHRVILASSRAPRLQIAFSLCSSLVQTLHAEIFNSIVLSLSIDLTQKVAQQKGARLWQANSELMFHILCKKSRYSLQLLQKKAARIQCSWIGPARISPPYKL